MITIVTHPVLGTVHVTKRANTSTVSVRWKSGELHASAPSSISLSAFMAALDHLAPRIMARRPSASYSEATVIATPHLKIAVVSQSLLPDKITVKNDNSRNVTIAVGSNLDLESQSVTALVSRAIKSVASRLAQEILLPRARQLARQLGVSPASWSIGHGDRRLGCCNSRSEISISRICIFLPQDLLDYIICHELAHLTEMNHSARFHTLCDQFCRSVTGHSERELASRLKSYNWPIIL